MPSPLFLPHGGQIGLKHGVSCPVSSSGACRAVEWEQEQALDDHKGLCAVGTTTQPCLSVHWPVGTTGLSRPSPFKVLCQNNSKLSSPSRVTLCPIGSGFSNPTWRTFLTHNQVLSLKAARSPEGAFTSRIWKRTKRIPLVRFGSLFK